MFTIKFDSNAENAENTETTYKCSFSFPFPIETGFLRSTPNCFGDGRCPLTRLHAAWHGMAFGHAHIWANEILRKIKRSRSSLRVGRSTRVLSPLPDERTDRRTAGLEVVPNTDSFLSTPSTTTPPPQTWESVCTSSLLFSSRLHGWSFRKSWLPERNRRRRF